MDRPSHKEINRKIKQAKEAVLENRVSFIDATSIASDTLELGYMISEISDILVDLLAELTPEAYMLGNLLPSARTKKKFFNVSFSLLNGLASA